MELSDLASMTPLAGGWSGLTFLGEVGSERVVVRLYPPGLRPESAPEVDAALHALVRGLLPVPEVVEVVRGDADTDRPGLLITAWVEGTRGDVLLPRLDDEGLRRAGRSVGTVAATLAGMPTLRAGSFVDGDLTLGDLGGPEDLSGWVAERLAGEASWVPLLDDLLEVAVDAQLLLDDAGDRHCLVHSDLNPKNLLLDPESLEVVAVLDWEFAHAGHPATDLGNLLRLDRAAPYVGGVLDAWTGRHGGDREEVLATARAADLWALVDLAARAGQNPVTDRADALLRRIAADRDVSAWPSSW